MYSKHVKTNLKQQTAVMELIYDAKNAAAVVIEVINIDINA